MSEKIYCISARPEDLDTLVSRKITEGFVTYDKPVKVGGGMVVQMMFYRGEGNYVGR